jgi:uncharacterized protein YxeA
MKKILFVIAIGLIILTGCTGVKTLSTGLENEAFIDDKTTFKAEVNKDHADRPKGKVYAISTGTHMVTVTYNNNLIFKKQIFVSAQETKKILLP